MRHPLRQPGQVKVHGAPAYEGMRRAGHLAAETLDHITSHVTAGVTTGALDQICDRFIRAHHAVPAPLHYRGFPRSICTSRNNVVCHGIPGDEVLADGDIVNIDVTVIVDGWHGDASRTYLVGRVPEAARRLVETTYSCLMRAIDAVRPGARLGDIGHAVQAHAEANHYSVVRSFCGHGIGRVFHDAPRILHYGLPGTGLALREGMFFTIEPMLNAGHHDVRVLGDGWTAVTRDGSLSAQFEHSLAVTRTGHEIFTLSPRGQDRPGALRP
ncbi:MAG: type I methionyl aminopeptidase [Acidobacteriota bacterium]